jgi:hypothetical protein
MALGFFCETEIQRGDGQPRGEGFLEVQSPHAPLLLCLKHLEGCCEIKVLIPPRFCCSSRPLLGLCSCLPALELWLGVSVLAKCQDAAAAQDLSKLHGE